MRIPPLAPDASFAQLVVDDDGAQVRRFRSAEGLVGLACSGSAQFSAAGWQAIRERLAVPQEQLYAIDLRQESHGFLNDAAVSWYAQTNWGCAGLSDAKALHLEDLRLALLERGEVIQVGRVEDVKNGTERVLSDWLKRSVASEERMLGLPEGHYVRLPVTDHARPSDDVVDRFIQLVRGLREPAHLHFHCRGGKGRTTTFMALYDMLRNASRDSFDAILERQRQLNEYDLNKPANPSSAKAPYIHERGLFLREFYEYARANPGGTPRSWMEWLSRD